MKTYIFLLFLIAGFVSLGLSQNASAAIQIDPASIYLNDSGNYVPYKLIDNTSVTKVLTKDGSFVFNKNTCAISFYNNTDASGSAIIGSDSYSVLASQGNTGVWNPVSIINNAACNTAVTEHGGSITITGTKTVSGAGTFQINYTKTPLMPVKLTFSATNNNPSWTNYHIGLRESIQVPKILMLGNQSYNLSQYNNTILNRAWIVSHQSQLIRLNSNAFYDMGLGLNNINSITIHWINNQASLDVDYTYNTPIISPGQTITVDPSITLDTSSSAQNGAGGSNATLTLTPTIGVHSQKALIVVVQYKDNTASSPIRISSVKLGSLSFTKILNKTGGVAADCSAGQKCQETSIWYLTEPFPTGLQHITITPSQTTSYFIAAGVYSLYNVQQSPPYGITNSSQFTASPTNMVITPIHVGSWLIDSLLGDINGAPTSPTPGTQLYSFGGGGEVAQGSQYVSSPTIHSKNTLGWTITGLSPTATGLDAVVEILSYNPPSTPTLSKVNTINSTAINATWTKPTGATWFWLNATLSGGSTTHINTTATTLTLNNYTAGSKYTISLVAANGTGKSSGSITKYNYTKNIAPTSLSASNIAATTARITWTNPTGNFSGFKIEQQPAGGIWSTVVSNTANSTNHRDLSGLTPGIGYGIRISTNYAVGSNYSGTSSPSSILNFTTYKSTNATIILHSNIVGDVIQINSTVHIISGNPSPITLQSVKLYRNGTLYNTTTLNHSISTGSSYNSTFWYQFLNIDNQTWHAKAVVTNFTGTPSQTLITISSIANITEHRQYLPDYQTAKTPSLGLVNYTISRPTPTSIILAANRDLGGTIFPMECLYQTSSQAITGGSSGTWVNKTSVGYWYQNQAVSRSEVYYITCYDPNEELFNTRSLVNGSSVLFGIQGFDNTFGAFLGLPIGVFFIVMAAALGNRRTAPMWVVVILAIAGLMATIGFFTLDQNIWYLAIIAGLLGLFVGRKLF